MSVEAVLARTQARKSAGARQTYPEHARRPARPVPLPVLPCAHEGPVLVPCHTCTSGARHVRDCERHGRVTRVECGKDVDMTCDRCRAEGLGYQPVAAPLPTDPEWVTTARLAADSVKLASLLPPDVVGVVGLPRSGMIPASIISAHLHLPLYELTHDGQLNRLGHGSRGRVLGFHFPDGVAEQVGRLAVVDDTVYGGNAMRRAREAMARLGRAAVYAVVYSRIRATPGSVDAADIAAVHLPTPHLLEWNLPNNGPFVGFAGPTGRPYFRDGVAVDLDGVLLHDAESGGLVGGPYLVPRTRPCKLIVTGRRERHRAATEGQLRRQGVAWERLEMLPDTAPDDTAQTIARHKAAHYGASGCGFFFESDPLQAELIAHLSGKPVVCPRTAQVWHAGTKRTPPPALLPDSAVAPIFAPLVGRKVALVHSPTTGNCGDRLIEMAAEQLLARFGIEYRVTEPDRPGDADAICLFGGGNYGHEWCKTEAGRRAKALATGKPCVLLPQTCYGSEPRSDYRAAFVRDVQSLQHLPTATLAPDLVLCYRPDRPLPPPVNARLDAFIRGHEGRYRGRGVDPRRFDGTGPDYLEWVAGHAEVHTDAMHIAICALIAGRDVTLYPTDLPKQRGVWECWLRDLGCKWAE